MKWLLASRKDWTGFVLRLTIAVVLFPHGAQKLLGWWQGHGYAATMKWFTDVVHLPYIIGLAVIMIEFVCPLLILAGILSRLFAMMILIVMIGIIITVQHQHFFMDWFQDQQSEGIEFFLLLIGLCLALVINGSGRYAFDNLLTDIERPNHVKEEKPRVIKHILFVSFSLFFINGCSSGEGSVRQLTQDNHHHNELVVRTYFDQVWNRGRIDLLDTLLTKNYINHTPSIKDADLGVVGLKSIVTAIRTGMPDLHYDIEDIISTDERVVVRVVMTGTHTDTLFNLPPTGLTIKVNQINIEKMDDGRISEHWRVTDELEMMKQLGFVK